MSNATNQATAEYAMIWYDESDPKNRGWAYNVVVDGDPTSGALMARRRDAQLPALLRELRRGFRCALPDSDQWRATQEGQGWEVRP